MSRILKEKYELLAKVDEDEQSLLFRGRTLVDPIRDVDVRILKKRFARDPEKVRRFTGMGQSIEALSDPGIVRVLDIDYLQDLYFVVTEHAAGQSLDALIRRRVGLPLGLAVNVAIRIGRILGRAQREGIKNRAVTAADILLAADGAVKVLGFRYPRGEDENDGRGASQAADVFFVGTLLYEILTHRTPNQALVESGLHTRGALERPLSVLLAREDDLPLVLAPVKSQRPDAGAVVELRSILFRCFTRATEKRYAGLDPLIADLSAFLQKRVDRTDAMTTLGASLRAPGTRDVDPEHPEPVKFTLDPVPDPARASRPRSRSEVEPGAVRGAEETARLLGMSLPQGGFAAGDSPTGHGDEAAGESPTGADASGTDGDRLAREILFGTGPVDSLPDPDGRSSVTIPGKASEEAIRRDLVVDSDRGAATPRALFGIAGALERVSHWTPPSLSLVTGVVLLAMTAILTYLFF